MIVFFTNRIIGVNTFGAINLLGIKLYEVSLVKIADKYIDRILYNIAREFAIFVNGSGKNRAKYDIFHTDSSVSLSSFI